MQPDSQSADLAARIGTIRIAMFTSLDPHGHLTAQPMCHQGLDSEGNLWFFTTDDSPLWRNIGQQKHVNVCFANAAASIFVSVSGHAAQVRDAVKARALWNNDVAAWLPRGLDDPHLVLVRVEAHTAEYWDAHGNRMVDLFRRARAAITGQPARPGMTEHGRVQLH